VTLQLAMAMELDELTTLRVVHPPPSATSIHVRAFSSALIIGRSVLYVQFVHGRPSKYNLCMAGHLSTICAWQAINSALWALGVVTKRDDEELRSKMAYGMFDTRGRCRITPSICM
jgi:hypothetical protein